MPLHVMMDEVLKEKKEPTNSSTVPSLLSIDIKSKHIHKRIVKSRDGE
jgi:hypothetical protein